LCRIVDHEVRKAKRAFILKTSEITPEVVEAWPFSGLQGAVGEKTPVPCEPVTTDLGIPGRDVTVERDGSGAQTGAASGARPGTEK